MSVPTDRVTGEGRGFAFIDFYNHADAAKAIEALHGTGGRLHTRSWRLETCSACHIICMSVAIATDILMVVARPPRRFLTLDQTHRAQRALCLLRQSQKILPAVIC